MAKEIEKGKLCAVLSYILIGIIWYFVDKEQKKNAYVRFHVQQALTLLILSVIVNVTGTIIPILGWFIILPIGGLIVFIFWIIGVINALSGKEKELPLIGKYGKRLNI